MAGTTTSSGAFSSSVMVAALKSLDLTSTSSASCASTFEALQPISLDFFFLLNEPSLNGDAKLFFFLGGVASAAVAVVVVVAVLTQRRR